jgi:hypothetical protein
MAVGLNTSLPQLLPWHRLDSALCDFHSRATQAQLAKLEVQSPKPYWQLLPTVGYDPLRNTWGVQVHLNAWPSASTAIATQRAQLRAMRLQAQIDLQTLRIQLSDLILQYNQLQAQFAAGQQIQLLSDSLARLHSTECRRGDKLPSQCLELRIQRQQESTSLRQLQLQGFSLAGQIAVLIQANPWNSDSLSTFPQGIYRGPQITDTATIF